MKVALIDPSLFTWPYNHALAEGLKQSGHAVTMYTKHLGEKEQGKNDPFIRELFYPGFQSGPIKKLPHKIFLGLKGVAHIASMFHLLNVLRKEKPDAIHFQWTPLAVVDQFFIPLFRRIAPTILTVHDSSPFNNNPSAALQRVGAIKIMNKFDHLIVHTEKARKALIGYGIPEAKISRIDHGILDNFDASAPAALPAKSADAPVNLLLFGQIKPYKGTDILLSALALLPAQVRQQCKLSIVGKPQMEMQPLFDMVERLGLKENVVWDLRFVDEAEIPAIFAAADVMVMPYREIDASGVLMLALAVGRPIVATRIGLFAEILEDGKHGFLVPQDDAKALATALESLIKDTALRTTQGENVLALRTSIPSWHQIGMTTAALYSSLTPKV